MVRGWVTRAAMKILYLNYEFPPLGGGGSPVSYEIARGYARRGHTVDVVTMGFRDLPSREEVEGISIFRVPCIRARKEICHPWEQLSYLASARSFLTERLRNIRYDICHTHFIIPTGVLALWVKKRFGLAYVLTAHGSDVLGYNRRFALIYPFIGRPWKAIVRGARYVTAPSDFLIQRMREIIDLKTYVTVPNGIDLSRFRPMKKRPSILVVARLFQNKGVQDVLRALSGINLKRWSVDIVGDGPYRQPLVELCGRLGLEDSVRFHGWIDNDSLAMKELYGRASVYVSASYFESFGMTVLESLSAGCYPVLSDIGGHRFIVDDDRCFFPPGDIEALRMRLQEAIDRGAKESRIDISRFTWDRIVDSYCGLLEG